MTTAIHSVSHWWRLTCHTSGKSWLPAKQCLGVTFDPLLLIIKTLGEPVSTHSCRCTPHPLECRQCCAPRSTVSAPTTSALTWLCLLHPCTLTPITVSRITPPVLIEEFFVVIKYTPNWVKNLPNSPILRLNHKLNSIVVNKGWIHGELR